MLYSKIKYRPVISIISLFYVNFFFLSPFFHHHNSALENLGEKNDLIHSYLFNEPGYNTHSEHSEHHFEDDNHCTDVIQNSIFFVLIKNRIQRLVPVAKYTSISEYLILEQDSSEKITYTYDDFSQVQLDKFVNSATNISPPLV